MESFHARTKKLIDAQARLRSQPLPNRIDPGAVSKSLATYADELPAQLGAEQRTLQGKLLAKLEPKNPRLPASLAAEEGSLSKMKFFQARDFKRLRGFSRVGGVLIGNDPTRREEPGPDVVDLRWELDGSKLCLVLVTADGREVRPRPYRRSLAYLALAYVADGRKVAVTIADADPLGEHTVLLHPALVDTALGRRVIELDQFIARYTRQDEQQNKAVQTFYAQNVLYQWAWGKRVLKMPQNEIDRIARMLKDEFRGKLLEVMHRVQEDARRTIHTAEADRKLLAEAWAARAHFGDPHHSPWTARKRYYDESLVRLITKQAEKTADFEVFSRGIDAAAADDFWLLVASFDGAVQRQDEKGVSDALRKIFFEWLAGPPRFGLRYIVRERAFAADLGQMILRDGEEPGAPFDLFLQLVFTSEPDFTRQDTEPAEGEEDDRWWEFTALSPSIQRHVTEGVAKDPRAQTILTDVAEFAYLQRLFPASLSGHLGERFPVEKLVAIMDATAPAAPQQTRTLRWDMRQGPREVVAARHWLHELGSSLPHLDSAWQPTWLNQLQTRDALEEADWAKVFEEYSSKLGQELARLPAGDNRLPWCQQTFAKLEPYRRLIAEAAIEQQRFKQASERGRDWKAVYEAHAHWHQEWGQSWPKAWASNRFDPPPAQPRPQAAPPPNPVRGNLLGMQGGTPGGMRDLPGRSRGGNSGGRGGSPRRLAPVVQGAPSSAPRAAAPVTTQDSRVKHAAWPNASSPERLTRSDSAAR